MMAGFAHDVAGGSGNLVITAVQSPGYVAGVAGWQVRKDGSAEFNNLVIRGTFRGTDFEINPSGAFFYTGTPAAGNLSVSVVPGTAPVSDGHGNTAEPGLTAYVTAGGNEYALQLGSQVISGVTVPAFFINNLTSTPTEAPAYTATQAGTAGCGCEIYSGRSTPGSTAAGIAVEDSTESGVPGGLVQIISGETVLNNSAVTPTPYPQTQVLLGAAPASYSQSYTTGIMQRLNTIIGQLQATSVTL